MTSLIERAAERLRSETTGKRHLIPTNADTLDPLAAAIATAEDYDRFSAGLISSPPAILATVQRDMAALAAAHMERIRDEPQMDMREAKAIVRIVLAAIREPSEAMQKAAHSSRVSFHSASGMFDIGNIAIEYPDERDRGSATVWRAMIDAAMQGA